MLITLQIVHIIFISSIVCSKNSYLGDYPLRIQIYLRMSSMTGTKYSSVIFLIIEEFFK